MKCIHTAIMIGITLYAGRVFEGIIFILVYSYLRRNLGGYHSQSKHVCFTLSFLIIICFLMYLKFSLSNIFLIFVSIFSTTIILIIGPVDTVNKPATPKEIKFFKGKIRNNLYFLLMIKLIFIAAGSDYAKVLSFCLLSESIDLLLGIRSSPIYYIKKKALVDMVKHH